MNNLQPFFIREKLIHQIRDFFLEQSFHEVFVPIFNETVPTEPNIFPFVTKWKTHIGESAMFLTTSPEQTLKKYLAAGIGDCFAISSSFRNLEGAGSKHIPEYLMLELYREEASYKKIMSDLQNLLVLVCGNKITYQGNTISLSGTWPVYSMSELFEKHARLDMNKILEDSVLFQKATEKGYSVKNSSWSEVFDQIFVQEIEQNMPLTPYFIVDFPARLSPLCKIQKDKPYLADRFEFFLAGMEIANGNNEKLDSQSIQQSFEEEKKRREKKNLITPPIDYDFIDSVKKMSASGKSYAGIGLGIDRLAMIMADISDIKSLH